MARFCPECGARRVDDTPACEQCGYGFSAAEPDRPATDEAPVVEPPASLAEPVTPAVAATPPEETQAEPESASDPPVRSRKRLVLALGVAGLIAVGAGVWWTGIGRLPGSGTAEPGEVAINAELMPVAFGQRCGYVDSNGRMVINPQFEGAEFFLAELGVAPVMMGGKWGLIDRQGAFVVNPQFDTLNAVAGSNLFVASIGQRYGLVDARGAFVVNPQFSGIWPFDTSGRAVAEAGGRYGIIDMRGNYVVPPQYEGMGWFGYGGTVRGFADGPVPAKTGGQWGYLDSNGAWAINPQFAEARMFDASGLAAVRVGADPAAQASPEVSMSSAPVPPPATWGYIDRQGRLKIAPQFANAGEFAGNGMAPVQAGGVWGYVDRTGAFKINPQFINVGPFTRTPAGWRAIVAVPGGTNSQGVASWRYGIIDERGTYTANPQFDGIGAFDSNGRAVVTVGNMSGLIDPSGRFVANPLYSQLGRLPGTDRYLYQKSGPGGAEGTSEVGWLDSNGQVLSTVRGRLCQFESEGH
jgi:hypothetical protein